MAKSDAAIRLTDEQRLDWLRLIRSENIGPRNFRALVNLYGGAGAALTALPDLARRGGARRSGRICTVDEARREIEAAARVGVRFIALGETDYPAWLRRCEDAPPLLSLRGRADTLALPLVGLVGSRNASGNGLRMAERLSAGLAASGFGIVSGLARGIDAAAHRAALKATVAVLAGGQDAIYPQDNVPLLEALIEAGGCAVSEMPMGWQPRAQDFPRRNRIIAGLSMGVVVVEAAMRSGSLITARLATEIGREVFAVPGSPLDPRAEGTNRLLKNGATLVTEAADVVAMLEPLQGGTPPDRFEAPPEDALPQEPAGDERGRIVALLGPSPTAIDDLIRFSGARAAVVRMVLLELEIAGRLESQGGGLVSLRDASGRLSGSEV